MVWPFPQLEIAASAISLARGKMSLVPAGQKPNFKLLEIPIPENNTG